MSLLKLGFLPLIDAAPLVVAKERGFFAAHGLDVELKREASWATIRDKVAIGVLDGAQMLAPVPLAMTLGLSPVHIPMVVGMVLNLGGNTITLSNALWDRMCQIDPDSMAERPISARALKAVIEQDKVLGKEPMTFASVYHFSSHLVELRYWMEASEIDTTQDVRFRVVPASQMISFLSADVINGYCVGEPWGSLAVTLGLGRVAITSPEIFAGCLEKVFAVTKEWADKNLDLHIEVLQALIEAAKWCDGNRYELAELLAHPRYVNAPVDAIAATLVGGAGLSADLMIFHRWCANFPWRSQAMWYLEQMKRWGTVPLTQDSRMAAEQVYRPDLYRQAAQALGIPTPKTDYKSEGNHPRTWILDNADSPIEMGPDLLLDGAVFDPHSINSSLPKGITVSGDMT